MAKVGRPKKSNPSSSDLASRKWYSANKTFKKKRANARNKARRKLDQPSGEVHHKDGNTTNNSSKNLVVAPKSHGRTFYSRKKKTRMKNKIK